MWRIFLLVLLCLSACSKVPDEQRLRAAIGAMQHAIEAHDLHGFMSYISRDFTGNAGQADHDALANLLRLQVLRNDKLGVLLGPVDVELKGDRATVHVTATLTGGSGGLLPEHGAVYAITSGWRKEGPDWRCVNASWEQEL